MKKYFTLFISVAILSIVLVSCGKNAKPAEIKDYATYLDPVVKFSIKHPSNWYIQKVPGMRFLVFTAQSAKDRFVNYDPKGEAGAKLEIFVTDLNDTTNLDKIVKNIKKFPPEYYTAPQNVTIDGSPAIKQSFAFDLEDGPFHGEIYYATKDNKKATIILFEAFGGTFEGYRKAIDEMLASAKLAEFYVPKKNEPITIQQEVEPASAILQAKTGDGYTIEIPDNFRSEKGTKAGIIQSRNYIGDRRADCNIQVDVVDATKSKSLDKIVEENRPTYQNAPPKETNLGGEKAFVLNYSAAKGVMSRVYFVKKANRLIKITVNWSKAEEQSYLPIFEKCLKSFKFM